ncbi:hypothetical protein VPH35_075879 [Triticum aestivum]
MEDASMEFLLDAVDRFPLREEFADNLEHPDPITLVFLEDDGAGHMWFPRNLLLWVWLCGKGRRRWNR